MTLRNLSADDPSVTFDFRKSKYLDPRITFTRASFAESGTHLDRALVRQAERCKSSTSTCHASLTRGC